MFEITIIIAVVVALTQLMKAIELIPTKYIPVISLGLGIVAGIFYIDGFVQD